MGHVKKSYDQQTKLNNLVTILIDKNCRINGYKQWVLTLYGLPVRDSGGARIPAGALYPPRLPCWYNEHRQFFHPPKESMTRHYQCKSASSDSKLTKSWAFNWPEGM
jgi:hypothetical protein